MPAIPPAAPAQGDLDLVIRPLQAHDLEEADRVFRLAFATFVGMRDPASFAAGRDLIGPRFRHDPDGMFAAEIGGRFAGSAIANRWGAGGFLGPLTVHPDFWDRGVGRRLMEPCMDTFDRWQCSHVVLFTFPHSAKHVALYQKFGFWPRFLTTVMAKPVTPATTEPFPPLLYSSLPAGEQAAALAGCRDVSNAIYPGLDLTQEILAVQQQTLGDTVLVRAGSWLEAFAVCHFGAGTEGGPDDCYVKFGAVRPGPAALAHFDPLLDACEELAVSRGLRRVLAGVSTARHEAYRHLVELGYRTEIQGLGMSRDNLEGWSRPGLFVLDDWR